MEKVKKKKEKGNFPARENAQNSIRARRETKNGQFNVHNRASAYFFECREIPWSLYTVRPDPAHNRKTKTKNKEAYY